MFSHGVGSPTLWIFFNILVIAFLILDLMVFHRKAHEVKFKEALNWSIVWVLVAFIFNAWVYYRFGKQKGLEFFAGYLIERSLSVDNLFVFLMIFSYFRIEKQYQHRILFWGILGALITRGLFILAGAALIQAFHWILYVFGLILVITGFKLFTTTEIYEPDKNFVLRLCKRCLPMAIHYKGSEFFVREQGKILFTPLMIVLLVVEWTDVMFAVDSIPAVFAVTNDPFIAFTSNIFAILGLRAMYFLLAGIMDKFKYLKHGLAFILIFLGAKMLLEDVYKISITQSLLVVGVLLAASILASVDASRKAQRSK